MDPLVDLHPTAVTVPPGGDVNVRVQVVNPGSVQTEYQLTVLGPAESFARLSRTTMTLNPGKQGEAEILFQPPRDPMTPTGQIPFGVKVESLEEGSSTVAEGDVTVGDYAELTIRLIPTTSKGRWKGRHKLTIDNEGSARQTLQVRADEDSEAELSFAFTPEPTNVVLGPGQRKELYLVVRAKHPSLLGKPEPIPFTLLVGEPSRRLRRDPVGKVVQGIFRRRQVLSTGLVALAAGAVALAALAIVKIKGSDAAFEERTVPLDQPAPAQVSSDQVNALTVSWTPVQGATGYRVVPKEGEEQEAPAEQVSAVFPELESGQEMCFTVVALGDGETLRDSEPSSSSCGTPQSPDIPPPELGDVRRADGSLTVAWTSEEKDGEIVFEVNGKEAERVSADATTPTTTFDDPNPNGELALRIYRDTEEGQSLKVPAEGKVLPPSPIDTTVPTTAVPNSEAPPDETFELALGRAIDGDPVADEVLGVLMETATTVAARAGVDLNGVPNNDTENGAQIVVIKGFKSEADVTGFCKEWKEFWAGPAAAPSPSDPSTTTTAVSVRDDLKTDCARRLPP